MSVSEAVDATLVKRQNSIKLNVHRPNGDLIVEETVKESDFIGGFLADLDARGLVPVGRLVSVDQDEENDDPTTRIAESYWYVHKLLWNGMKLDENVQFEYYVSGYDMSVSGPVDVTVFTTQYYGVERFALASRA